MQAVAVHTTETAHCESIQPVFRSFVSAVSSFSSSLLSSAINNSFLNIGSAIAALRSGNDMASSALLLSIVIRTKRAAARITWPLRPLRRVLVAYLSQMACLGVPSSTHSRRGCSVLTNAASSGCCCSSLLSYDGRALACRWRTRSASLFVLIIFVPPGAPHCYGPAGRRGYCGILASPPRVLLYT